MTKLDLAKTWEGRLVDGRFPLRQYLGGSEHSAVFLTEIAGTNSRKVTLKLIEVEVPAAENQLSRLRTAAALSHPHLIRIFETGRCQLEGTPFLYFTMEYAEEDLSQILPERALTPPEVSDMLPPLLDALSFLHSRGLVHGSIKPSNVQAVDEQLKLSSDHVTIAIGAKPASKEKDAYTAPEIANGIISPASDVWSLGMNLVATLTQEPIPGAMPDANPMVPDSIPEPFRGIARECLQVDPKRRASVAQIYARLHPEARSVPHEPETAVGSKAQETVPFPTRSANRRPVLPIAAMLIVAAVVVFGIVLFHGKSPAPRTDSATQGSPQQTSTATPPATAPSRANAASPDGGVIHQVLPEIPKAAQNTITGVIKITVRDEVDASGRVTAAKLRSSGPSKYFARFALQAAEQWQFSPPEVNGQAAPSVWLVQFRLRRTATQASAQRVKR